MDKIDFKKTLKSLYGPKKTQGFHMVDVPAMRYLMVDGHGDPNTAQTYKDALETLYAVAYALKFASKKRLEKDYVIPPLEGLWWSADMDAFLRRDKSSWDWTMMIMVPDWIGPGLIDATIAALHEKKPTAALGLLRVEQFEEGRSVQILHVGPYDAEGPVLERLHKVFIPEHGLTMTGKHHEIYLSDPRKTASEKLRTILRQPVKERPGN